MNKVHSSTFVAQRKKYILLYALAGMAILLICSMCSPLYAFQPSVDVQCFLTVARGILHGKVPYKDFVDHKGPMLYYLHALALAVVPYRTIGILLWEWVSVTASMCLIDAIARLYCPRLHPGWPVLLMALVCASTLFTRGDQAEEHCLPLMLATLYMGLRILRGNCPPRARDCFLHGILAGCVMCIKINLLGAHFAFMAVVAIYALVQQKRLIPAVKLCIVFLAGMGLVLTGFLLLLGWKHAIREFVSIYIRDNLLNYGSWEVSFLPKIVGGLSHNLAQNPAFACVLGIGLLTILVAPMRAMNPWEKALWLVTALSSCIFVYMGGNHYDYYLMALIPLAVPALMPIGRGLETVIQGRSKIVSATTAVTMLVVMAFILSQGNSVSFLGYRYEDTPQYQIAQIVGASEDQTLLNFSILDQGFYMATNTEPVSRYFCLINAHRKYYKKMQKKAIQKNHPNFLVTVKPLDVLYKDAAELYELRYEWNYEGQNWIQRHYYLYQRKKAV